MEKYQFPGIIGVIDGTHIKISAPRREIEHIYYCRKGGHSKNVMIICDLNYIILAAKAQIGGTAYDSYVWRSSQACRRLEDLYTGGERNYWLLGDSVYLWQVKYTNVLCIEIIKCIPLICQIAVVDDSYTFNVQYIRRALKHRAQTDTSFSRKM